MVTSAWRVVHAPVPPTQAELDARKFNDNFNDAVDRRIELAALVTGLRVLSDKHLDELWSATANMPQDEPHVRLASLVMTLEYVHRKERVDK